MRPLTGFKYQTTNSTNPYLDTNFAIPHNGNVQ
ncbi:hypothetical protein VPHD528_0146 [Vibrio phage D528]